MIALAPLLQRSPWLFPMPGARHACPAMGRYEAARAVAAAPDMTGRAMADVRLVRDFQAHSAVADCLAFTTTRWLPAYAGGVAVLVALGTWTTGRARTRGRRRRDASASA